MKFKKVLLVLIFIVCLIEICVGRIKCSKIYVIPLFAENSTCGILYAESCITAVKMFIGRCGSKSKNPRQMLSIFNFNYEIVYTCIISNYIAYGCDVGYNEENNVTLVKNEHSSIWPQIERQIKMDKQDGCYENSLALFLTDIPCQDYKYYPNMMELFGFGLNNTMEKLLDLKLHAYAVWLYNPNKTENLPCNDMKNLTFTDSNNLETHHMFFNDLIQDKGLDLLCTTDNFPKPRGTLKSPDYTALTVSVSIGCGVIFALILLFVAFWSRQIYRRWQESKIEAFADAHAKSARHLLFGKYLDEWEVTPKELRVDQNKVLGKGAFATVYKGHLKKMRNDVLIEMDVAAKFPHIDANQKTRQDMISEIGFMKSLGNHEHLLVMVGYVKVWEMLSGDKKPFENMDLDEFINFLESNGKIEFSKKSPIQLVQILENYCFQKEPDLRLNFMELKEQLIWFYKSVLKIGK